MFDKLYPAVQYWFNFYRCVLQVQCS